ncbi:MAG: regulatory protein RecX [Bacillota bacterium]|nr:regulatory protein RecX [Bacillota bacterium]
MTTRNKAKGIKQDLAEAPEKIFSTALAYLSRREYSQQELCNKLRARGAAAQPLAEALERLKRLGYLDELRYAQAFVRSRRDYSPRGRRLIARELADKGVDAALIEQALDEEYGEQQELAALQTLIARQLSRGGAALVGDGADDDADNDGGGMDEGARQYRQRQKLLARLQRKGFSYALIRQALQNILSDNE